MTEEIEKYRYAQAQAWLKHVRDIGEEVDRLQGLVESEIMRKSTELSVTT